VTLLTGGGENNGDTLMITKQDTSRFGFSILNNSGQIIGLIPAGSSGFFLAKFNAFLGDWFLEECGSQSGVLSRQKYIDGGTQAVLRNGAISQPYQTITEFTSVRGNASVNDATTNYVGIVVPAINGYSENISFTPYASTELRAESFSIPSGTRGVILNGNATWLNSAGANVGVSPTVAIHNISVGGTFTVSDDGGAPTSTVIFGSDEIPGGVFLSAFDATGANHLGSAQFYNAEIGNCNAGNGASAPSVVLTGCTMLGVITAGSLKATDTLFAVASITVKTGGVTLFSNCTFSPGSNPLLTCTGGGQFDGQSWSSFIAAGGTRAAGTFALVTGGYNAAPIEGATLSATADTSVSLNGNAAGTTTGYTGNNSGNHYTCSNLTANRAVKALKGGGEMNGDTLLITKNGPFAFDLSVQNSSGSTVAVLPSGFRAFALLQFSSLANEWLFVEGGQLS
jgi:hypothetical protein